MTKKKEQDKVREQPEEYPEPESEWMGMEFERYEIIEGIRYDCSPSPTVTHQQISGALYIIIYNSCHPIGTLLYSPIDIYLDEDNQFQPDLVFILHRNAHIVKEKRIEGAPDLVVEILSPSTSQNDKIRKKRQYERHGVQEYWIADPVHATVDQFLLQNGRFVLHETYGVRDTLTSPLFSCLSVEMKKVFASLQPPV